MPPSKRYLNKGGSIAGSPKESSYDIIKNQRQILYTKLSIDAKKDETIKLKEYIQMELEKLEEAQRTFQEDCDRFQQYLVEMDSLAEKAKENTEVFVKQRQQLCQEADVLKEEVHKYKREIQGIEEELKISLQYKEFVDEIQECGALIDNFKNENPLKQIQIVEEKIESQFFMTEDQEEQDLFEIQMKQLELIRKTCQAKINDVSHMIHKFEGKILEQKQKAEKVKEHLELMKNGQDSHTQKKLKNGKQKSSNELIENQNHPLFPQLKALIFKIFTKIRQRNSNNSSQDDDIHSEDIVSQLSIIERELMLLIEARSYMVFSGENPDAMKQILEKEKNIDKDRKQIRYERKKKFEEELIKSKNEKTLLKIQKAKNSQSSLQFRALLVRSKKPQIVKIDTNESKVLTQEEIDYQKYVGDQINQNK